MMVEFAKGPFGSSIQRTWANVKHVSTGIKNDKLHSITFKRFLKMYIYILCSDSIKQHIYCITWFWGYSTATQTLFFFSQLTLLVDFFPYEHVLHINHFLLNCQLSFMLRICIFFNVNIWALETNVFHIGRPFYVFFTCNPVMNSVTLTPCINEDICSKFST